MTTSKKVERFNAEIRSWNRDGSKKVMTPRRPQQTPEQRAATEEFLSLHGQKEWVRGGHQDESLKRSMRKRLGREPTPDEVAYVINNWHPADGYASWSRWI